MDPFLAVWLIRLVSMWLLAMASFWMVRGAVEDLIDKLQGRESRRQARRRAREELTEQRYEATGIPPLAQAVSERLARRVANPPKRRKWAAIRAYIDEVAADGMEDALRQHQVLRQRRQVKRDAAQADWEAAQEQVEQERAERKRADRERRADAAPQPGGADADKVTLHLCANGCGGYVPVSEVRCDESGDRQCPGPPPEATPPASDATDSGWVETTDDAETEPRDAHRPDQAGPATYRQWEQAHPRGSGTLRTTCTAWAHDDGQQRLVVTELAWQWIDSDGRVLFDHRTQSHSSTVGAAGEPWPTEDDLYVAVSSAQPASPADTPLLPILDAAPCPGPCVDTWTVDELCANCAAPPAPPADTPPAQPNPGPDADRDPDPGRDSDPIRKAASMNLPARNLPARRTTGDTADPRLVLAYAQRNLDDNDRCQRQLVLMMRKLQAFGVGDDTIRLVGGVWRPGNDFADKGAVIVTTAARHVATRASLALNLALCKTVHDTYLSADRVGTLTVPPSEAAAAVNGDVRSPGQAAKAMQAVMNMRRLMIGGIAKVQAAVEADGVQGDLITMTIAQRKAASDCYFAAERAAADFVQQMHDTTRFWETNPDLVGTQEDRWMSIVAGR